MPIVNAAYDSPTYQTRQTALLGVNAAGSGSVLPKFVAWTNMILYAATAVSFTAGTSTSTFWNGTATVTSINGDSFTLRRYTTQNATGTSTGLTTATFGTFAVAPYNGTATGTQTNTTGVFNRYELYGTATSGVAQAGTNTASGGVVLQAGDVIDILRGTDATAVTAFALEYRIQPLANITSQ